MPKKCALGCPPDDAFTQHKFPHPTKNSTVFKAWVDLIGGKIEDDDDYHFYNQMRICDRHFVDRQRNRNNRLNALAVPVLYLDGRTRGEEPVVPDNTSQVGGGALIDEPTGNQSGNNTGSEVGAEVTVSTTKKIATAIVSVRDVRDVIPSAEPCPVPLNTCCHGNTCSQSSLGIYDEIKLIAAEYTPSSSNIDMWGLSNEETPWEWTPENDLYTLNANLTQSPDRQSLDEMDLIGAEFDPNLFNHLTDQSDLYELTSIEATWKQPLDTNLYTLEDTILRQPPDRPNLETPLDSLTQQIEIEHSYCRAIKRLRKYENKRRSKGKLFCALYNNVIFTTHLLLCAIMGI